MRAWEEEVQEGVSAPHTFRCALPGLLLALVCLLPFLNKAYTIDDPYFLFEARQTLQTPLTPTAVSMCWENVGYKRPLRQIGSPAVLMAYLLTPVVLLQAREWAGHLLMLLVLGASIVATVRLAFRCGADRTQAIWAGLILAAFPAVLGMAGTVMPDVPVMCLSVIGMERLLAWKAEGRIHQALASGLALGLAPLGRVHTILLLPLAAVILAGYPPIPSLNRLRQSGLVRWLPVVLALVSFATVTWLTSDPSHGSSSAVFVGGPNLNQLGAFRIDQNLPELGLIWMLAAPLGIAWLLVSGRPGLWLLGAGIAGAAILKYGFHLVSGVRYAIGLLGVAVLAWVVLWAWRSRQPPMFWLALWLLIPVPLVPYLHLPSKYMVPCAPAAAILLARRLSLAGATRRLLVSAATVIGGAAVGVGILHADAAFAGLARQVVNEAVIPQIQAGRRVWYSGEWALTWYGEQAGADCLLLSPLPAPGDIVVAGVIDGGAPLLDRLNLKKRLVRTISRDGFGVRIMNPAIDVGFYSNFYGYLPWRLSSAPVNTYYVWQIE